MPTTIESIKRIKDYRSEDRPREKFLEKGKEYLSDAEILAIILGSGTKSKSAIDLANELLNDVKGNLASLARFQLNELMRFKGIGPTKAMLIMSALEFGNRKNSFEQIANIERVQSSKDAYMYLKAFLSDLVHEEFWVVYLSRSAKVIKIEKLSQGGIAGTAVDLKLIFKGVFSHLASSIILAHNHPSGNLAPSQADKDLTKRIIETGKLMDIQILDHLIVGVNQYLSFADEGLM